MSVTLDPSGRPVDVGRGVTLRTPGLRGEATVHPPGSPGMRAAERSTPEFDAVLEQQGVTRRRRPSRSPDRARRRLRASCARAGRRCPRMRSRCGLRPPARATARWSSRRTRPASCPGASSPRTRPRASTSCAGPCGGRRARRHSAELVGAIGKKVIKVLAFKLVDEALGAVGEHFARKWEERRARMSCVALAPSPPRPEPDSTARGGAPQKRTRAAAPPRHVQPGTRRVRRAATESAGDAGPTLPRRRGRVRATSRCPMIRGSTSSGSRRCCPATPSSTSTSSRTRAAASSHACWRSAAPRLTGERRRCRWGV